MASEGGTMTIKSFAFHDRARGWSLREMELGSLNLLVGVSGVGKTRILECLRNVRRAALFSPDDVNGCTWTLRLEIDDKTYVWSAETSTVAQELWAIEEEQEENSYEPEDFYKPEDSYEQADSDAPRFVRESIEVVGAGLLVERSNGEFLFDGNHLPRLKSTESAINILRNEEKIRPFYRALSSFVFSETEDSLRKTTEITALHRSLKKRPKMEDIQSAVEHSLLDRLYLLQKVHSGHFENIKKDFLDIFPSVEDVGLVEQHPVDIGDLIAADQGPDRTLYVANYAALGLKEAGVSSWIFQDRMSSGMLRVLTHLVEIALAPRGTVIAIDEFENSLGVNCLPQITDRFLERAQDLQLILTSHHPYVINNIPHRHWKLVTRRESVVSVTDAVAIPSFNTSSAQDKFIQLLNAPEYEEGIA